MPASFARIVAAVETVSGEFSKGGHFRQADDSRWVRDIGIEWEDPIANVSFLLDTEAPLLAVYVTYELAGAERVDALARAAARASFGLLPGTFEVDVDTGETRFRSVLYLPPNDLSVRAVAQLLADALVTAKRYAPAFASVVRDGTDPIRAVDEAELMAESS